MVSTDVDGLHGNFLTGDEFGQRLFAVTTSGLTIVQLANVPLGIGSICARVGRGGWERQCHDSRQRVSVDDEVCAGWQTSFCDVQGYEYPQYCYPRVLQVRSSLFSSILMVNSQFSMPLFRAIISANHSLVRFILVCENSMREGQ